MSESLHPFLSFAVEPASPSDDGSVEILFIVHNEGHTPVNLLKRNTPLEGLLTDCLIVLVNGKKVPYDGKLVKRGDPEPDEFVVIPAGGNVNAKVDLTDGYHIEPGAEVEVSFDPRKIVIADFENRTLALYRKRTGNKAARIATASGTARFTVHQPNIKPTPGEQHRSWDTDPGKKKLNFNRAGGTLMMPEVIGGDAVTEQLIRSVHRECYRLVKRALKKLREKDARQYRYWFDRENSPIRKAKVVEVYQKIKQRMEEVVFRYDVTGTGCGRGHVWGYTFHGSRSIWLCVAFWTSPFTGNNSQAGTFVHEHSHASANTEDHDYSEAFCSLMAKEDPDLAIDNADNYEFFAERQV